MKKKLLNLILTVSFWELIKYNVAYPWLALGISRKPTIWNIFIFEIFSCLKDKIIKKSFCLAKKKNEQ